MRSLALYLAYYGLAVLLGFLLRTKFDTWMYSRPHMQRRLVLYCSDVLDGLREERIEEAPPPPLTVDTDAVAPLLAATPLERFVRQTEADRRLEEARERAEQEAESAAPPAEPSPDSAAAVDLSGSPPTEGQPYSPR